MRVHIGWVVLSCLIVAFWSAFVTNVVVTKHLNSEWHETMRAGVEQVRINATNDARADCEVNWHLVNVGGQLMKLYSYYNQHMGPIGNRIGEICLLKSMLTYDELKALWKISNPNQRQAIVREAISQGFCSREASGYRVGRDNYGIADPVESYDVFLHSYEDGDSCEAASIMDKEWNQICDSYPSWLASKGWRITVPEY